MHAADRRINGSRNAHMINVLIFDRSLGDEQGRKDWAWANHVPRELVALEVWESIGEKWTEEKARAAAAFRDGTGSRVSINITDGGPQEKTDGSSANSRLFC